jgi:YidC/Oxa1 family membrane protein insertase
MDLGQPERLFINGIGIPVLAILVTITTLIQSRIMQPPSQGNDQAASMSNSMTMMMPLMMGWMAFQFSAGLALYFLISNLTTMVQYVAMGRADWSRIFPWMESKDADSAQKVIIETVPDDDDDDEEEEETPVKIAKPSARSAVKRQRPKMKR